MNIFKVIFTVLGIGCALMAWPLGAEAKTELKATITFQDGTVTEVSEPSLLYSWVRSADTKYINPPVFKEKSLSLWKEKTSHGTKERQEIPLGEVAQIMIIYGQPQDTCSLKAEAVLKNGSRITEPEIYAVPENVAVKQTDAIFFCLEMTGTTQGKKGKNKFSIKLFGSGICPDSADVVKKIEFH